MANSPKTFLKHAAKGIQSRSVNPAIIRASTILFKTIQELRKHQKDIAKGKSVAFWTMAGREVKQQFYFKIYLKN